MKIKILILAIIIFAVMSTAHAEDQQPPAVYLIDVILYRPLGLIATVTGSAVFVAISPLTALAAISPPHDAFEKTANLLIMKPAKYTFDRPMGVYYPDGDGEYRRY
ncbi:hypothetical protein [Methylobacter sp.]|jgi:uncharacterized protein YggT (Ycf19 family)|uniref:hypothetical protein n=1 Tax=Methylobacter sp. TaxID=2051955 RepID=UPI003DA69741